MQTVAPCKRTPVPTHLGKLPECTSLRFFLSDIELDQEPWRKQVIAPQSRGNLYSRPMK